MRQYTLIPPGDEVHVVRPGHAEPLPAFVLSVEVNARGGVRYYVSWWSDEERHDQWVADFEVKEIEP